MNWTEGIQNAVDYVEEHLTDELDFTEIAAQAACSSYYFQKIFSVLCGMTLGEYIRGRRLALAGSELISTDIKIIDLALKYGYGSPESFTRAFTLFHGAPPSEVRRGNAALRSFSRLKVQIIMKGGNIMDYKIVEKPAFRVLEKVEQHTVAGGQNKNTIPGFWERAHKDGTIETLLSKAADKTYIFGICYGNGHSDSETFDYSIAAAYNGAEAPEGYSIREIPARKWVVAECKGAMPEAIQRLWHQLCTEFFPASGYTPTYELDIEAYPEGDMTSPDYRSEIWIPIFKDADKT